MASTYLRFLDAPSTSHLAPDATISYITTTTTISGPDAILKHLAAQAKHVERKAQKVLDTIESTDGLCLETETSLLFKDGGGVYLPGIDGNLLDERLVLFPLTHIVRFDAEQKIKQVRIYWDQGTLLKQVEVIGRTGRNWPIRDGKAQLDAVTNSVKSASAAQNKAAPGPAAPRGQSEVVIDQHRKQESVSAVRDPHASLSLFTERDPNENTAAARPTKSDSARPLPRQYEELFVGPETPARTRPVSPTKAHAGKQFTDNRLFDENNAEGVKSPDRKKTYEQKYEHFAFGDGEDARPQLAPSTKNDRNQASFSFQDFSTPPKVEQKYRPDFERHWGAELDEVQQPEPPRPKSQRLTKSQDAPPSPPKRPVVHHARPDSVAHYTLTDEAPASAEIPKIKTGTGVDQQRRANDFGAHYTIADKSPGNGTGKALPRGAPRNDQVLHWGHQTPTSEKKIYVTAGDGMGGRGARQWGFGEESDPEEVQEKSRLSARTRRARAQGGAADDF